MKRKRHTISFRVDLDLAKLIDRECEPYELSRGEWVRGEITKQLQRQRVDEIATEMTRVRGELGELLHESQLLQAGIRRLAYVVMTQGEPLPSEDARVAAQKLFQPSATSIQQDERGNG